MFLEFFFDRNYIICYGLVFFCESLKFILNLRKLLLKLNLIFDVGIEVLVGVFFNFC